MNKAPIGAVILFAVALTAAVAYSNLAPKAQGDANKEIRMLIEGLYSPNDAERDLTKREILDAGTMAINPLCSLLNDLLENPYPRFPKGQEEEAARALNRYSRMVAQNISLADHERCFEIARKYFINSRIIWDIVELVGQLRANAAIPNLIKIMQSRDLYAGPDGFGKEMVALTRIGTPAIPYLIVAIKDAKETARRREDVYLSFDCEETNEEELGEIIYPEESEGDEEIAIRLHKIQLRTVMVLGQIDDSTGQAFLEAFSKETADESVTGEIQAILKRCEKMTTVGNAPTQVRVNNRQ